MLTANLYEWVLSSYKQTSKRLNDTRGEIKNRLDSVISLGQAEAKELFKTFGDVQKQVAGLKIQLEDRFVRRFEAVLDILGVPSLREVEKLRAKVEKLDKRVKELRSNNHKTPNS